MDEPPGVDTMHPQFCLECIHKGFSLTNNRITREQQASFAQRLEEMSRFTWGELKRFGKHEFGLEKIKADSLHMQLPTEFSSVKEVLAFRYRKLLPMVGVREGRVFHVLAIERAFGDLYHHSG